MITINVVTVDEKEFLTGSIGRNPYKMAFSKEAKDLLLDYKQQYDSCGTVAEATEVLEKAAKDIARFHKSYQSELEEILKDDLYFNAKKETYHIKLGDKISDTPVNKFFVDKMIEAVDKDLSPKPWLIFWVRMMRNPLYANDTSKVKNLVRYLKAQFTNEETITKLMDEDGYSKATATELATHDQISITEQGILAAFKYVRLMNTKFVVEKDEETGEQTIVEKDRYTRTLEVDEDTGEVTKDELNLPDFAEDIKFLPPIMGKGGDAFSSHAIDDMSDDKKLGHTISVGKIHELSKGFDQVNTCDDRWGVKGLHLGGYYYVQNFGGKTDYLVDCLIAPEDIGAVADIRDNREGAIRCRRYMVTGAHFKVNKGMYHPSDYAQLMDHEWIEYKKEVIAKAENSLKDVSENEIL